MKLIQTNFTYQCDAFRTMGKGPFVGSYLGRKPATLATIRRFLATNARRTGNLDFVATDVKVLDSSESRWIAK